MKMRFCKYFVNAVVSVFMWCNLSPCFCHGVLSTGVTRLDNGQLSGRLFVKGQYLVFRCEVTPEDSNRSYEQRVAYGYSFVSMGHSPSITIYNSTWKKTFVPDSIVWDMENGEWKLVLARATFSFSDDICEDWKVAIQLDVSTSLMQHVTTLVDFRREPVLTTTFGSKVKEYLSISTTRQIVSCILGQSACSPDVAVAVCTSQNQDIFFGVTHGAFTVGSTEWSVWDFCPLFSDANDCQNFAVFDVVLTSTHILILTSSGVVSGSFLDETSKVDFQRSTFFEYNWSEWMLSHTPKCSAGLEDGDWAAYIVFLMPKPSMKSTRRTSGFWAVPPYAQWRSLSNFLGPTETLIIITYNWQSGTLISLSEKEKADRTVRVHPVSILTSQDGTVTTVPPVSLPQVFKPNGVCFHPVTNHLYLFGNKLLTTSDGGTTFKELFQSRGDETVISCHPSKEHWLVFLTSKGSVLFTLAGHRRVVPLLEFHPSTVLFADALGNLLQVRKHHSRSFLASEELNININLQDAKTFFKGSFSVFVLSPWKMLLLAYTCQQFSMMQGTVLKSDRSHSSVFLQEEVPPREGRTTVMIGVTVRESFQYESKPGCDLDVVRISETLCELTLSCDEISTQGWEIHDVGKTVHIIKSSSYLVLDVKNASVAVCRINLPSLLELQGKDSAVVAAEWGILNTRPYMSYSTPTDVLRISKSELTAYLDKFSEFQFSSDHVGFLLLTPRGEAVITDVSSKRLVSIAVGAGKLEDVLEPGEWILVHPLEEPLWHFEEDSCKHVLEPDEEARRYKVRYLDLGTSFSFTVVASTMGDQDLSTPLMEVTLSNPRSVYIKTQVYYNQFNSEIMKITVTHATVAKGSTALTVSIPSASLRCKDASFTITFHCSCPPSKHLHFIYTPYLTDDVFLNGNPVDPYNRPLLQNLEVNYRPPSKLGIDIPTNENIYNADPNVTRPRQRYNISKMTGHFKQCAGKTTREECGCTRYQELSSLAKNSDCRRRAYRLIHAGKVSLKFVIREQEKEEVIVREPVAVTLTEINDRVDYIVSAQSAPSLERLQELDIEGSLLLNSTDILLTLTGSGLYHFRAKVAAGFSYCDLQDEFQYYVDLAPLPNPTPTIVIAAVSVLMGTAFFVWYLRYLHSCPQPSGRLQGVEYSSQD